MVLVQAVRYVTTKVDERVVTPLGNRLANSVANPYVLSYFIWERIKRMTPQRARDLTRLLSIAIANAVGVLGAEQAKDLAQSGKRLQDEVLAATVTPQGREVVLNSVATASKVAQALNTPETKVAIQQVFETMQSVVDFFASTNGRKVIATAGECVNKLFEVAASPESSVFLAEVATNVCHALEAEALRRKEEEKEVREQENDAEAKPLDSPRSSFADTIFDTESEAWPSPRARNFSTTQPPERPAPSVTPSRGRRERTAGRSARIEKDVLLKMGVDPSMLSEIQRVLDTIRDEEEQLAAAAAAPVVESEEDEQFTDQEGEDSNISSAFGISNAFGFSSADMPLDPEPTIDEEAKTAHPEDEVLLPDWHSDSVRAALRRRHNAATEQSSQRHTFQDQSREMAAVLTRRHVAHGELQPMDLMACRAISMVIVGGLAFILLLVVLYLVRAILHI
ncbi:hypothetical protein Poli38472_010122 [Pythium oligandrum]|uniref:Uncharacterized protein n=1 Tax=Pythium oligandrum TaxID=41045 RepID=A0A8K1C8W6_PYTOL|nr:hypothetical protein Poli38472_010122 [Pythium oligandrum]|eukprot:TMW58563.1 hypothetical protein Poli38472_010122 [Pythium oligandrum]